MRTTTLRDALTDHPDFRADDKRNANLLRLVGRLQYSGRDVLTDSMAPEEIRAVRNLIGAQYNLVSVHPDTNVITLSVGVDPPSVAPLPEGATAEPPKARGRPKGSSVPKPRVPTRPPNTQNEHMYAILNHPQLTALEQHFGLVAHVKVGSDLNKKGKQFGDPRFASPLPSALLAREAKRSGSISKAGEAMTKMVQLGLWRRLDNGQGDSRGRSNSGPPSGPPCLVGLRRHRPGRDGTSGVHRLQGQPWWARRQVTPSRVRLCVV